ncbi:MAG: serine/threonine protein phosphatase [Bacteroidales bacterium]|nr:serine/threonine protein phosphatase [Bacteroidales bacterium]
MKRRWVIPDIHGCVSTLKMLVESGIQLTKEDSLYFLGDYIDRGHDGKGVIDYIMSLQDNGYDINYLIGNHEYYCMNAYEQDQHRFLFKSSIHKDWERYGAKETLKSFGVKHPRDIDKKYIDWMKNGKYFIELEDFILVHAGMNFNLLNPFEDTMSMLWVRDFKVNTNKIGGKKIIHGHVPVEYSLIQLFIESGGYDFIALDNGVYYQDRKVGFGNLMALELNSMELLAQPNIDY